MIAVRTPNWYQAGSVLTNHPRCLLARTATRPAIRKLSADETTSNARRFPGISVARHRQWVGRLSRFPSTPEVPPVSSGDWSLIYRFGTPRQDFPTRHRYCPLGRLAPSHPYPVLVAGRVPRLDARVMNSILLRPRQVATYSPKTT